MQSPSRATRRQCQRALEFARRYLAAGWRLIPNHNIYRGRCTCRLQTACAHPGKHPRIAGWTDATAGQASNDLVVVAGWITRWPWLNLGLATGHGLLALDIDPAHGGLAWWTAWQRILGPTARQITGSGGLHLLYRVPEQYYIKTTGPASHPLAPGVDTRGDGGQIIVAPSRNIHGPYRWVPGWAPWDQLPAAAPPALLAELREKQILVPHSERVVCVASIPSVRLLGICRPSAEMLLDKYVAQAAPGNRNTCGFHLALQLRDNGCSLAEADAWMLRYQQALDLPINRYTADEALTACAPLISGLPAGRGTAGQLQSPHHPIAPSPITPPSPMSIHTTLDDMRARPCRVAGYPFEQLT